jgi:hypothetical protein
MFSTAVGMKVRQQSETKMKDRNTHLAYKAELAVELTSNALVARGLQPDSEGDTGTIHNTLNPRCRTVFRIRAFVSQGGSGRYSALHCAAAISFLRSVCPLPMLSICRENADSASGIDVMDTLN